MIATIRQLFHVPRYYVVQQLRHGPYLNSPLRWRTVLTLRATSVADALPLALVNLENDAPFRIAPAREIAR